MSNVILDQVNATMVRAYAAEHQCGMMEAKQRVYRQLTLETFTKAKNLNNTGLLFDVVEVMLKNYTG